MDLWERSRPHKANLLNPHYISMGVGLALRGKKVYYVHCFSGEADETDGNSKTEVSQFDTAADFEPPAVNTLDSSQIHSPVSY